MDKVIFLPDQYLADYVAKNTKVKLFLGTECSMSDNVQADNPNVEFIKPCNLCPYMKKITLQKNS